MKKRQADNWEELARREPYFTVLTDEGSVGVEGNREATAAFFETGEADIASLLSAIASLLGREIALTSALDFGCGAGRLTLPLARRAGRVVACDIAPTMLAHARKNAEDAGLQNVTFIESHELAKLPAGHFDFVCSLLVLQYIPPAIGYPIIRRLLEVLAPGGVAALHVTFDRRGGRLRRLARWDRERSRRAHRVIEKPARPFTQMHEYAEYAVHRCIEESGARVAGRFATHHGDTTSAVLVIEKPAARAAASALVPSERGSRG